MRVLIAFSAITLIAVMSFVTVPAFAAKSCDEYCLGVLPNRSVQELVSKHLRAEMPHEPSRSLNVQASASQPSN